jgi:Fe2+ or Zn2+ uptake regulation protein
MSKDYWLEQRILRYLQTHQQAGDTLEGIAKWWLTSKLVDESVIRVRRSLDNMKSKGVVRERRLPDGKSLYVLNDDFGLTESTSETGTVISFPAANQTY